MTVSDVEFAALVCPGGVVTEIAVVPTAAGVKWVEADEIPCKSAGIGGDDPLQESGSGTRRNRIAQENHSSLILAVAPGLAAGCQTFNGPGPSGLLNETSTL